MWKAESSTSWINAPAILSHFSRLLIDPNRGLDDPTLIMQLSDGAIIPGNAKLTAKERQYRIQNFYLPYHQAIDSVINQALDSGRPPVLFSVHSFTPFWKGAARPWHATILHDSDLRFAGPVLEALTAQPDLVAGDNVPYSGDLVGDCLYHHGTSRGIASALIELRQDLVATPDQQQAWADRLAGILETIIPADGPANPLYAPRPPAPAASG